MRTVAAMILVAMVAHSRMRIASDRAVIFWFHRAIIARSRRSFMATISCKVSDGTRTVEIFAPEMLEVNALKIKKPWHLPPISKLFSALIGQVAFAWADFENEFDLFLQGLVDATSYTKKWRVLSYKTRSSIFKTLIDSYFDTNLTIKVYAEAILGTAANTQAIRNDLAHGRLRCELKVVGGPDLDHLFIVTTLLVYSRKTNAEVGYTPDHIENAYHKIAHLSGLMYAFSNPGVAPSSVSSQDTPALLDFLRNHHPRSKEPTLGHHPGSSEG
jgi:hypothetical protein